MLAKCRAKLAEHGVKRQVDLRVRGPERGVEIEDASLVLMVLTLQFIRPLHRERLIADIYQRPAARTAA